MSIFFNKLKKGIKQSEIEIFSGNISQNIPVKPSDIFKIKSYCILCHAGIEDYIESIVRHTTLKNFNLISKGRGSKKFIKSISFWFFHKAIPISSSSVQHKVGGLFNKNKDGEIFSEMQTHVTNVLQENHGIREDNLKKLLEPLGIPTSQFDQIWLNDMDTFGKLRGNFAHTSPQIAPSISSDTAVNDVKKLMVGLEKFDGYLTTY